MTNAKIKTIKIADIKVGKRKRHVNTEKLKSIMDSIEALGLINPITVNSELELIAGNHRLEAFKALGKTEIPVIIADVSETEAELMERNEQILRRKGQKRILTKQDRKFIYPVKPNKIFKTPPCIHSSMNTNKQLIRNKHMYKKTINKEITNISNVINTDRDIDKTPLIGSNNNHIICTNTNYEMISSILYLDNLIKIILDSVPNKTSRGSYIRVLHSFIATIKDYRVTVDVVNRYREIISSIYDTEIVNDYISLVEQGVLHKIFILKYAPDNKGRKEVPLNNADGSKNLAYSFYGKTFVEITGKSEDDVIDYAIHFFQITMFIILSELLANRLIVPSNDDSVVTDKEDKQIIETQEEITSYELNIPAFYNYINLAIVTGLKPMAEFQTTANYGELFEELCQLKSKAKWLNIRVVDKKQTIQLTARNNYFLENAFKREGYHKTKRKYDTILDTKNNTELRIMRGGTPNSIHFTCYMSGMRTISRLLSLKADPEQKIYLSELHKKGADLVGNIIGFYFRALLNECKFKSVKLKKSYYTTYTNFISSYKDRTGKLKNIPLKALIAILLSKKAPEQREELINKYFTKQDTQQKAGIRADLVELDTLLNNDNESTLALLYKHLRRHYGW